MEGDFLTLHTSLAPEALKEKLRCWEPWSRRLDFDNGVSTLDCDRRTPFNESPLKKFAQNEDTKALFEILMLLDHLCIEEKIVRPTGCQYLMRPRSVGDIPAKSATTDSPPDSSGLNTSQYTGGTMAFSATWHRKLGLLSPLQLNAFVDTMVQSVKDYINRRTIFHVEFPLEKGPWLCLTELQPFLTGVAGIAYLVSATPTLVLTF
jgi:hypothetical protein